MKATIVSLGDDWEGLYIDGVLKCEGHSLRSDEVIKACGVELMPSLSFDNEDLTSLPDKLEDCK